tara:strand:- start:284 stop:865 length:582 start_codon:yes stop_codon:yes gene_type:complete
MTKIINIFIIIFLFLTNNSISKEIVPIIEGDINAKIKIVVYESMTCGHCADFHKNVYPNLKEEFIKKGLVKIEFRNFPLDLAALNASKLAHCKNDGKSETLHVLYNNQHNWIKGNNILEINNNLEELIKEKNININFDECLNNKTLEDFILEERIKGHKEFDIQSTPTLIINDKKFEKTINYKNLKKILKKMI